ncbi:MAG: hypothetical protein IKM22_04210 [Clostridia bacterium]|nr:hypothetical protein [Clostridia bacterium]
MYNTDETRLFSAKAKNGLCSHAYIVDGAAGIGKLDFALECARTMLCTEKDKPCGYCESCRKALSGNHPDIHIVGDEKTAQIADIREIIRKSSLKPNDSEKQIFIVCNAGKLRAESQNALLKLFEEPPETVAIFLLTESRSSLLPTVLSRGQRIHLDGMRDSELEELLLQKNPLISRNELRSAIETACGNYGIAEKYLSKASQTVRVKAETLLTLAISKKSYELGVALITPKYKRDQISAILNEFVAIVNSSLKAKYGIKSNYIFASEECKNLASSATKRALAKMGESATVCLQALEKNANVTASASKLMIDLLSAAAR